MSAATRAFAASFTIHGLFARAAVTGFDAGQWGARVPIPAGPSPESAQEALNHAVWQFAHLTEVRGNIARALGAELPSPERVGADFGDPCHDASAYPSGPDLLEEFCALGETIVARLASIDPAHFDEPYSPEFPDGRPRTIAEAIPFLVTHEALHIGQLSLLRRLNGHGGIAQAALAMMDAAEGK